MRRPRQFAVIVLSLLVITSGKRSINRRAGVEQSIRVVNHAENPKVCKERESNL